ncbi:DUF3413 domain-containing protein [Algicola sagamiensis]|uniref:DUF3413 domain-containing protein n=1 Tax=Algicola sagamiensis TaxID=163869 RepID=UPI0003A8E123|nr:DUF3413 domain-containing protein [Algicola sagamiensis]
MRRERFSEKMFRLLGWGHWFTFFNIILALLLSTYYIATDPLPSTFLGGLYSFVTLFGHIPFLFFIGFVLTIFPISLIFPYPRHIRGMAALIAGIGMFSLIADAMTYNRFGYHLGYGSLQQSLDIIVSSFQRHPVQVPAYVIFFILGILAFELVISNFTWRHLIDLQSKKIGRKISFFFIACFCTSQLLHIWGDATLNFDITKQNNMLPLSYPATAKTLLAKYDLLDKTAYDEEKSKLLLPQPISEADFPKGSNLCKQHEGMQNAHILFVEGIIPELAKEKFSVKARLLVSQSVDETISTSWLGTPMLYEYSQLIATPDKPKWVDGLGLTTIFNNQHGEKQIKLQVTKENINFYWLTPSRLMDLLQQIPQHDRVMMFNVQSEKSTTGFNIRTLYGRGFPSPHHIVSTIDILPTLVDELDCRSEIAYFVGESWLHTRKDHVIGTYFSDTIISGHKDIITSISTQGDVRQLSLRTGRVLTQPPDIRAVLKTAKQLTKLKPKNRQKKAQQIAEPE